ncbi:MAG: hypothetical protein IPM98_19245 [Lewinellaceae bacterium]|nr:hypothetical protein [Lewinellaceae bacterium]
MNGQSISEAVALDGGEIGVADSFTREMWYGNYIRLLESGVQSNSTIGEVVENSIVERVLALHGIPLPRGCKPTCLTCQDESQLVGTTDILPADSVLRAWPNPFTDQVTIEVRTMPQAALLLRRQWKFISLMAGSCDLSVWPKTE